MVSLLETNQSYENKPVCLTHKMNFFKLFNVTSFLKCLNNHNTLSKKKHHQACSLYIK